LGGSINILSGYEKKTPEILNLLNLEWLWRLRFDTVRRILRLIETSYLFTKMLIFKQNKIH
jgi:Teichoic acid biosynthesis proteins